MVMVRWILLCDKNGSWQRLYKNVTEASIGQIRVEFDWTVLYSSLRSIAIMSALITSSRLRHFIHTWIMEISILDFASSIAPVPRKKMSSPVPCSAPGYFIIGTSMLWYKRFMILLSSDSVIFSRSFQRPWL